MAKLVDLADLYWYNLRRPYVLVIYLKQSTVQGPVYYCQGILTPAHLIKF